MRHRLLRKVFDGEKNSISSSYQKSRTISSTFTKSLDGIPHLTKNTKLHSKSTYFYHGGISSKFNYIVPSVCGLAFLLGGIIAISPTLGVNHTYADEPAAISAGDPSISLTVNGNTEMKNDTAKPGEVSYVDNTFSVKVTDSWYAVLVRAANGYTSDLINQSNTNAKVTGVGYNVSEANFKENTWGYALTTSTDANDKNLAYSTLPESTDFTPAYSNTVSGEQTQNFKVSFAAKFGNDAPSGHYQTKVYLSAVSNPTQVSQIYEFAAETMQELTMIECARAAENTTKRLRDERDDNYYWVTKLKDGNCWMTQNLDLDITSITKLTSDDSDIPAEESPWEPKDSVKHFADSIAAWGNGQTDIKIYDPGKYVYSKPFEANECSNKTELPSCISQGWQDVSGSEWAPMTEIRTDKIITGDNESSYREYDAHYLVGNYYSWNAATAGSGNSITNGRPTRSICPKNWNLPTGVNSNTNGSFRNLLQGFVNSSNYSWMNNDTPPARINSPNGLYGYPLYFFYSGFVEATVLRYLGSGGYYWSSTPASDGEKAFELNFFATRTLVSDTFNRYRGLSVRCLLKTND